jgi:hypothetical protein
VRADAFAAALAMVHTDTSAMLVAQLTDHHLAGSIGVAGCAPLVGMWAP